jgi:hypothetical protein
MFTFGALVSFSLVSPFAAPCQAELRPLVTACAGVPGPQGAAADADGTFWITSAVSWTIVHFDAELREIERFRAELPPSPFGESFDPLSGIACEPAAGTLLLCRSRLGEVWEVTKRGVPTGRIIPLPLELPPNALSPFPMEITFDAAGDGGRGSLWVVEAVMTRIYEVSLDGVVLHSFCHPDDPDGCPGRNASAPASGIDLFREGDRPAALELIGGRTRRERILRVGLDGRPWGTSFPLEVIGGTPGSFARARRMVAGGAPARDVLFVTVESSAEVQLLEVLEPAVLPPQDLECLQGEGSVELHWRNTGDHDLLEVRRDGVLIASLPSGTTSHTDPSPSQGLLEYEVAAVKDACRAPAFSTAHLGPGTVLRQVHLPGLGIFGRTHAVDLTEDDAELLWVTFTNNQIGIFDKELQPLGVLSGPFQSPGDITSGIAFNQRSQTFFVYNHATNHVAEMSSLGDLLGEPFPSGVEGKPDNPARVISMLYDLDGDGGEGSFWYLDYATARLEQRSRAGVLLSACIHPAHLEERPPQRGAARTVVGGLSALPGSGFALLEAPGGAARGQRTTHVPIIDTHSCDVVGDEISIEDMARTTSPAILGFHRTMHAGSPAAYAVSRAGAESSWLFELDAAPPRVPRPMSFTCSQPSAARDVELRFQAAAGTEAIEIRRGGEPLAMVDALSRSYVDRNVPAGFQRYEVRGWSAGEPSDERRCSLQVGAGSISARRFAPLSLIHHLAFDAAGGYYLAASTHTEFLAGQNRRVSDLLYRLDLELLPAGALESPFRHPMQVAALAIASRATESEIHCLGWRPGLAAAQSEFPLVVLDPAGRRLRELTILLPVQDPACLSLFPRPAGLAWDAGSDSLWLFDQSHSTVMSFCARSGELRSRFPHPAPIHQDAVRAFGIAVDGARKALYLPAAGRDDRLATRIVEATLEGALTGAEIPLAPEPQWIPGGFTLGPQGAEFVVSALAGSLGELVRHRAFDALAAVEELECTADGKGVVLTWRNAGEYDALTLYRGLEQVAALSGGSTSWRDVETARDGSLFYRLVAHGGGQSSPGALCTPRLLRPFLRGDVEENGILNLTDGVVILLYLFAGREAPACLDAADVDDSGTINITDAVALLGFLFQGGPPPRPPYPEPGLDPTPDGLVCYR